jgi:cysteine synthase A
VPIFDGVDQLIGRTPMLRLRRVGPAAGAEVCGKLESQNPGGSIKDRPALAMLQAAEMQGQLKRGDTIIEATSGNTGISLAMLAAVRGYRCVLVMPDDASLTRKQLLKSYGAEVVLTDAALGMAGAVEQAGKLLAQASRAFMPRQFQNPENARCHELTTAEEIWEDTDGKLDALVIGVGTGGTLTGIARALKRRRAGLKVIAVEPRGSAVLSGGEPGLHGIQGLGAGFIPAVLDRALIDHVLTVTDVAADRMARRLSQEEGLLVGTSAGANVYAAVEVARQLPPDQRVVTVLCDTGERYLA